jgi:hypothetical protein
MALLYPVGAVIPGALLSVLQYSPQFAAEQSDAATRFMVGYLQGVRDYTDAFVLGKDRDAAIDTLLQSLSPKDRHMRYRFSGAADRIRQAPERAIMVAHVRVPAGSARKPPVRSPSAHRLRG